MQLDEVIRILESESDLSERKGMERVAINPDRAYYIKMPVLRKIAGDIGKDHELALELWDYDYHETKILATLVEDYELVTREQFDKWVRNIKTWNECDQACINVFYKLDFVLDAIDSCSNSEEEFVKRTAFVLIAVLAVHDKKSSDDYFLDFFPLIREASVDERNFVKKAVNWAIRQIGKRNVYLNQKAIELSEELWGYDSRSAKWIAKNALKELKSDKIQERIYK